MINLRTGGCGTDGKFEEVLLSYSEGSVGRDQTSTVNRIGRPS